QIGLIAVDLIKTAPKSPYYLETIHPILMNHGVIVGMSLSAVAFFGVSLATKRSSDVNLAPFFKDVAEKLLQKDEKEVDESSREYAKFLENLDEKITGERAHLHLNLEASATVNWTKFIDNLKSMHPAWITPTGNDSIYRFTQADMLSCVSVTRGNTEKEVWFASEPRIESVDSQRKVLFLAFREIADVLEDIGVLMTLPSEN
ncbi:MAG: sodium:solute symporter family protein, partial [Methanosarcinaceae archaeon]|nr:sodium:solute symporter family protein [Methanosarcinaceae archaeon]